MISTIINSYVSSFVPNMMILGSMWWMYKDTKKTQEKQDKKFDILSKKQSEDIEFNTERLRGLEEATTKMVIDSKNIIKSFENLKLSLEENSDNEYPDQDLNKELIDQFSEQIKDFKSGFLLNSDKISNIHEILSDHEENIRKLHKRFDQDIVKEQWVFPVNN